MEQFENYDSLIQQFDQQIGAKFPTYSDVQQLSCSAPIDQQSIAIVEQLSISPRLDHSGTYVAEEAENSELLGMEFNSELEAYQAYLRYSYIKCFGIRYGKLRMNNKGCVIGRELCCYKEGAKVKRGSVGKKYTKLNRRTGCKAMVFFKVVGNKYVCSRHDMIHNHAFCHPSEVHHLRCHRGLDQSEVDYLLHLRSSGIRLADGVRSLVKEAGGSPALGFEYTDAKVAVKNALSKKFDSTDCHTFMKILKQRAANEEDFFYDFELDEDNCLVSVFFRDKKMRQDYEAFPEVLGNDGTYCTNKYDLICSPFVGINHHTRICMFGIGFMLNERIESYVWLYSTFLTSMGGIQPKTIMTDQCFSMSAAISMCFPNSKHRICVWHLFKNSAKHLGHLKDKPGFNKLFSRILKRCHTEEELNFLWDKMVKEYKCNNHPWLTKLYDIREKWCCAYGKDYFSAGILSSQRSESTNNSLCKRVSKTTNLCDFYEIFGGVVSDWRSIERKDNSVCWDGLPEVAVPCSLLDFGSKIYTISAYKRFEKEFLKSMSYKHRLEPRLDQKLCYYVFTDRTDEFGHRVTYDSSSHLASCTCKRFEEGGFLCRHILRIYFCHSVEEIPAAYILKRWTKDAKEKDDVIEKSRGNVIGPIWRLDMHRSFHKLIIASSDNEISRGILNDYLQKARHDLEAVLGGIQFSDVECGDDDIVQNPKGKTKKGERFVRKRSMIDIETSRTRGKFKAAETRARKRASIAPQQRSNVDSGSGGVPDPNGGGIVQHMGLREILMTPASYNS